MQKIDSKTVKGIAESSMSIDDENKASKKLKADHAGQYEKTVSTVKQLEEQVAKIPVLSSDKMTMLKHRKTSTKNTGQNCRSKAS